MSQKQSAKPQTLPQRQAPGGGQDISDEAQLEEAMKRLKLLHIKCRMLRETLPKMLDPLVTKQPSPNVMFAAFTKAINDAQNDIKEFTDLMRDETSKQVFAQAEKSEQANPYGIKPWLHSDHPEWFRPDPEE